MVLLLQKKLARHKLQLLVGIVAVSILVMIPLLAVAVIGKVNPAKGFLGDAITSTAPAARLASTGLENAGKTFLMFFVQGDEDYTRNLAGTPLLNTFAGLMLVLGILLAVSRRSRGAYTFLLIGLGVLLLPGIIGTNIAAPDAYKTALAMPFVFALIGLGSNYLLSRWYAMFPINSTARSLGLSFVILIMVLSAYQSYRQYFVAWAQDPQTFVAHREDLRAVAGALSNDSNKVFVVAGTNEQAAIVVARGLPLDRSVGGSIEELEQLPLSAKPLKVVIPADSITPRAEIARRLEAKYPGGTYGSATSPFNERQLYVWYKTK
jgi:hypothetical protein